MRKLSNKINWIKPTNEKFDYTNFSKQKRSIVFAQLCFIGAISALIQGAYDLRDGLPVVMAIDVFIAAILFLGFYLNYKGKSHFAKLLIFISINISLFLFAAIVPKGAGIYFLFFPLIIFYFVSYGYEQRIYAFSFTFLSLILNGILLITDFQPLGSINLHPSSLSTSFMINILLSFILMSLGILFTINLNHIGEQLLIKKHAETETLTKEVQHKNQSLEKTNKELDRFVYSTSHDLKSPLASILGLLNLAKLEKDPVSKSIAQYLDMMEERVNNLSGFINDILDYSRNARKEIELSNVNISELVNEVFLTNRFLINADKIDLNAQIEINEVLLLDKTRVFRVLHNLISNAIKYSDLTKNKPCVTVSAKIEHNKLVIVVRDNGIGIADEHKDKVFEMFFRGTEMADGSGLGLYIAQEMVLKMDGAMEFESKIYEGSIFTVKIPLAKKVA